MTPQRVPFYKGVSVFYGEHIHRGHFIAGRLVQPAGDKKGKTQNESPDTQFCRREFYVVAIEKEQYAHGDESNPQRDQNEWKGKIAKFHIDIGFGTKIDKNIELISTKGKSSQNFPDLTTP